MDLIFSNPLTDKVKFQKSIDFISDVTNMIYKKHKETVSNLYGHKKEWGKFMVKTATRVQQVKEKCVYFELPTEKNFSQN